MKNNLLNLTIAAVCCLPSASFAQGTYLSDPNDTNNHALVVAPGGNVGIGVDDPTHRLDILGRLRIRPIGPSHTESAGIAFDRLDGLNRLFFGVYSNKMAIWSSERSYGFQYDPITGQLDVAGKVNCTVLELTSDRAQKSGFAPVDRRAILDQVARLPITTWQYTNEPAIRHIGPVAQDFKAAFGLGSDDKHIATVDADGVLFAALQGLNQKLEAELQSKDARIASLEKKLAEQERTFATRFAKLEKLIVAADVSPRTSPASAATPAGGHETSASANER